MNQKCVATIDKIRDTVGALMDGLDLLRDGIEEENEEKINQAMDLLPLPNHVAKQLEKFRDLVSNAPWEPKRKKSHAG